MDLAGYWAHRFCHTSAILWKIHRIHHSQTELTPIAIWIDTTLNALAHSGGPWTFGFWDRRSSVHTPDEEQQRFLWRR